MATVSTNARVASYSTIFFASHCFHQIGANYYVVMEKTVPDLAIYKSTDSGANWAEVDAADAPITGNASYPFDSFLYDDDIYIVYQSASGVSTVISFDPGTDQWGASLGNATSASVNADQTRILVRSNGEVVVIFTTTSDPSDVHFSVYNGSWTSDQLAIGLTTAGTTFVMDAVIHNDIITVIAKDETNSDLLCVTIAADNSVSSVQTLNASVGSGKIFNTSAVTAGGQYVVAYADSNGDPATYTLTLAGVAPHAVSGPLVVAAKTITNTSGSTFETNGGFRFVWYDEGLTEINHADLNGSWSALTQALDGTLLLGQAGALDDDGNGYIISQNGTTVSFNAISVPEISNGSNLPIPLARGRR